MRARMLVLPALLLLAAAPARAEGVGGVWQGYYHCPRGVTSLTLHFEQGQDNRLAGLFSFGPHPESGWRVHDGSYALRGAVDPDNGIVSVRLEEWIRRPPGYAAPGLNGVYDPADDDIEGSVVGAPGCGCFRVVRAPARPAPNEACEGIRDMPVPTRKPSEVPARPSDGE